MNHKNEQLRLKTTLDKETVENLMKIAEDKGEYFSRVKKIKTHQIRNFYGAVNQLKLDYDRSKKNDSDFNQVWEKFNRELVLLKPKLAYAKGRNGEVGPFTKFMTQVIDLTLEAQQKDKALENFFELVQAVVAYHKFYGD